MTDHGPQPSPDAVTRDGFLGNRLSIAQPKAGAHRAGLDAVLLAAALGPETAGVVVDLGAGVGVAGLCVLARCAGTTAILVERDLPALALARLNVRENGFAARATVLEADATAGAADRERAGLRSDMADHLIMNPPFHPADRSRRSPAPARAAAHAIAPDDLERWLRTAAAVLRPAGTLTLIYRADELQRLLAAVGTRFGSLSLLPVHPRADGPATRLILRGRPQGRAPLRLLPPLVLHDDADAWRPQAEAVLRGDALPVDWW